MSTNIFKITLTLDANNANQLTALNDLICLLAGTQNQQQIKKEHEKKIDSTVEQNKKETNKKELQKNENSADKKTTEEGSELADKKASEKSGITVEQIRAEVSKKSGDNHGVIKKKLTDLGCNNVSTLAAENYVEFMAFLKEL